MFNLIVLILTIPLITALTTVGFNAVGLARSNSAITNYLSFIHFQDEYYLFDGQTYCNQVQYTGQNLSSWETLVSGWHCPEGFCSNNQESIDVQVLNDQYSCGCENLTAVTSDYVILNNENVYNFAIVIMPVNFEDDVEHTTSDLVVDLNSTSDFSKRRRLSSDYGPHTSYTCEFYTSLITKIETILVQKPNTDTLILDVNKDDWNTETVCYGSSCDIVLPKSTLLKSGNVFIVASVIVDNTKVQCYTTTQYITGRTICELYDCVWCYDFFKGLNCLPTSQKILALFMFVLVIVLAAIAAPAIFIYLAGLLWGIWVVLKMIWAAFMKLFKTDKFKALTKQIEDLKNEVSSKGNETNVELKKLNETVTDKSVDNAASSSAKTKTSVSRWKFGTTDIVLIMIFLPLVLGVPSGCTDSVVVATTFTNCIDDGNVMVCNATFAASLTLDFLNAQGCITLKDEGQNAAFDVKLSYTKCRKQAALVSKYYTSSWFGRSTSSHKCYKSSCSSGSCTDYATGKVPVTARTSNADVVNFPGKQNCYRSCGCATCGGCFYCESSCVYDSYGLHPTGPIYRVFTTGSQITIPHVVAEVHDYAGIRDFSADLRAGQTLFAGPMQIKVVGNLDSDQLSFAGNDLIVKDGTNLSWFAPSSPSSTPKKQQIGDIQSQSKAGLTSPNRNSFVFDTGVATEHTGSTSASYTYTEPGINILAVSTALPGTLDSSAIWSYEAGSLVTDIISAPAVVVTIQSPGTLTVVRRTQLVCPAFTVVNSTGCFSCPTGMRTIVFARSTCAFGIVTLTSGDSNVVLTTDSLWIDVLDGFYNIDWYTDLQESSFSLTMTGTGGQLTQNVEYIAADYTPPLIDTSGGNNANHTNEGTDNSMSGWFNGPVKDWFKNIFKGLGKWFDYAGFVLFLVVAVYLIFKFLWPTSKAAYGKANEFYKSKTGKGKTDKII